MTAEKGVCPMKKEIQSKQAKFPHRIFFYCNNPDMYRDLISNLTRDYIVTITSQLKKLPVSLKESPNQVALLEIPDNEEVFLYTLKDILRKSPATRIVILNGCVKKTTIAEAFRMGVCDYFPKPVNHSLLVERIKALVR